MDFTTIGQVKADKARKNFYLIRRYGMLRLVCNVREDDEILRTFVPAV